MMQVPLVWPGLRGTLGVQAAHLREHVARRVQMPEPPPGPVRRFRGTRAAEGLSAEQLARIVARAGGKWAESARRLAETLDISQSRIEVLRERERERNARKATTCAS